MWSLMDNLGHVCLLILNGVFFVSLGFFVFGGKGGGKRRKNEAEGWEHGMMA